ncbi:MAG: NUDIX domain-containing protein [Clostridiales bacterium]|nr:NUDIX domain-containing protein [Clostridiales bacterium]
MEEFLDVLDEYGNLTGKTKLRTLVHRDGDWHRSVHIFIINDKKEILLQRRAANKDTGANKLDISSAGHLSAGDSSLDGAVREIKEELDIDIQKKDLTYIGTFKSPADDTVFVDNEFNDVYILKTHLTLKEMTFQVEEISEIMFVPYKEFKKMVEDKVPELVEYDEEYKLVFKILETCYGF